MENTFMATGVDLFFVCSHKTLERVASKVLSEHPDVICNKDRSCITFKLHKPLVGDAKLLTHKLLANRDFGEAVATKFRKCSYDGSEFYVEKLIPTADLERELDSLFAANCWR